MTEQSVRAPFRFGDTIPYDTPASLDELAGPRSGVVRVSPHIDTRPEPVYDLGNPAQRWGLYSAVVRDGLPQEQVEYLDRDYLIGLWAELNLPARCRALWEAKFPELAATRLPKVG